MNIIDWYKPALGALAVATIAAASTLLVGGQPKAFAQQDTAPAAQPPAADTQAPPPPPDAFRGDADRPPAPASSDFAPRGPRRGWGDVAADDQWTPRGPRRGWDDSAAADRWTPPGPPRGDDWRGEGQRGEGQRGPGWGRYGRPEGPPPGPGFGREFGDRCPRGPRPMEDAMPPGPRGFQGPTPPGAPDAAMTPPPGQREGMQGRRPFRPNPEDMFKRIDANGDGSISKQEFVDFHEKNRPPHPPMRGGMGRPDDRPMGPPPDIERP